MNPITKLQQIITLVQSGNKQKLVAVSANDDHTITAIHQAVGAGLIDAILVGDEVKIRQVFSENNFDISPYLIIHQPDDSKAAVAAIEIINNGEAGLLMKGLISTDKFIRAILNKEKGLMIPGNILTHITAIENPHYHKLMIASDVAVLPQPDFSQKLQQIRHITNTAQRLGIAQPKIAVIAPSEQVLVSLESSKDAALLAMMSQRGQIPGSVVDGPLALDVAVDNEAAEIKGIKSAVAGEADGLLFPNLDAGNVFYKMNMKLAGAESAAMLVGARVPVVLSSRGDSSLTKLYSIALAALMSQK